MVQAAVFGKKTWFPFLKGILVLGDFRDYLAAMTWRALLLVEGDVVLTGRLLRVEFSQETWERWVDAIPDRFEAFDNTEFPGEEMFDLLRQDDDVALVGFCNRWSLWR